MRAADAVGENRSLRAPRTSAAVQDETPGRSQESTEQQEVRWHAALMIPRSRNSPQKQRAVAVDILFDYLRDRSSYRENLRDAGRSQAWHDYRISSLRDKNSSRLLEETALKSDAGDARSRPKTPAALESAAHKSIGFGRTAEHRIHREAIMSTKIVSVHGREITRFARQSYRRSGRSARRRRAGPRGGAFRRVHRRARGQRTSRRRQIALPRQRRAQGCGARERRNRESGCRHGRVRSARARSPHDRSRWHAEQIEFRRERDPRRFHGCRARRCGGCRAAALQISGALFERRFREHCFPCR